MKRFILSASALLLLAACDIQPGGNKNMIPISKTQVRYSDDPWPAKEEPNWNPKAVPVNQSDSARLKAEGVTGTAPVFKPVASSPAAGSPAAGSPAASAPAGSPAASPAAKK